MTKVWRGYFWAGKFGGLSPKRHLCWSNDEGFVAELLGRGGYLSATDWAKLSTRLTKKNGKLGPNGVPSFTGVKKLLKQSQPLVQHIFCLRALLCEALFQEVMCVAYCS